MLRKLSAALAAQGCGWLLWLYLSSPTVTYLPYDAGDDPYSVDCEPLGSLSRDPQSPDAELTGEQQSAVSDYLDQARGDPADATDVERAEQLRADLESTLAADCEQARLNRVAHLGVVAVPTCVLLLVAILGTRRPTSPTAH